MNVLDGNPSTFWDSLSGDIQPGGGPWLQIDLTRILKVYGVVVIFDANTNRPQPNFLLETSDSPTDRAYGTWSGSGAFDLIGNYPAPTGSIGRYGEFTAFIPTTSAGQYGVATTQSTGSFKTVDTRYIRIQSPNSSVPLRIVDVQVWASTTRANTTSRVRIGGFSPAAGIWSGGTLFSPTFSNDLLDVDVLQMMGRQVWSGTVILNNGGQKYSRAIFPEGTPVKVWIDGTTELLGTITNFDPKYSLRGLTANIDIRGYDDFLNQEMRYAWAATPISDKTAPADIISTGPNSILGLTTNSVGARVIGNLNTQSALIGPNNLIYYPAKDTPKLTVLNDLAETAIDGAWVLQNTGFSASLATYGTTLGRSGQGVSDGYWFGIKTRPGYIVDLRGTLSDNAGVVGAFLFAKSAITNSSVGAADTNPIFTWDGNIGNDPLYNYVEVFQSVFVPISATSAAGSLTWTTFYGSNADGNQVTTTGGSGTETFASQVDELIVEAVDKIGRVKRLHYIINATIVNRSTGNVCACGNTTLPQQFNYSGGQTVFPPPDTDVDKYIDMNGGARASQFCGWTESPASGTKTRNLYTDWTTKYTNTMDSGGSDVVTVIRIRQYPFPVQPTVCGGTTTANQIVAGVQWSNVAITPVAHVKTPPVRYEFYVHESSVGSQVPDLYFFPHPRPNIDLFYRNLDGSTNARWYTTQNTAPTNSLGSDFNNIETFDFMRGDVYRVKNDIQTTGGQEIQLTDKTTIDSTNQYYNYRIPSKGTHGSRQEQIKLANMASMTSIGRRQKFLSTNQTDPVALTRETVKLAFQNSLVENRGTIKVRGNAAYQPGYILTVESDYSELAGKYLIYQTNHKWNQNGYVCTLNVEDIDFMMSSEFARSAVNILQATGKGGRGIVGNLKQTSITKVNADLSGTLQANIIGAPIYTISSSLSMASSGSLDFAVFSLPLNTVNEFSNIRYVTITLQKLLGAENRGDAGRFGLSGGTHNSAVNTGFPVSQQEDTQGWTLMAQPNGVDLTISGEQNMGNPSSYIAQRFLTTVSTGSFLFTFRARMPAGSGTSFGGEGVLACSIWTDGNIGGVPTPSDPLVGTQGDITWGTSDWKNWVLTGGVLNLASKKYTAPTGWIEIPTSLISHGGNNASNSPITASNPVAVEIGLQQPVAPHTYLWFVMRVASAGGSDANPVSPWIQYHDNGGKVSFPAELSTTAGRGTTGIERWVQLTGVGGFLDGFNLTGFGVYGFAPLNSFGAWQPIATVNTAHQPGTVGFTSAAAGVTNLNIPVIDTDKNGTRQDVLLSTRIGVAGSGAYTVESVTGGHYAAISTPGQEGQITQIAFPTSFIATRDQYGDVYVSIPASFGGDTGQGTGASRIVRRADYSMLLDYTDY